MDRDRVVELCLKLLDEHHDYNKVEIRHRAVIGAYGKYGYTYYIENGMIVRYERIDHATTKGGAGGLPQKQPGDPLTGGGSGGNVIV